MSGRSSPIKRWPLAPPRVSVESELRDDQQRAANIRQRQVHLAAVIFKDAETNYLPGQVIRLSACVVGAHPEEHEQAETDFARDLAIHRDSGTTNALHHGAHLATALPKKRFLSGERLPAAIAVGEDVREADTGHNFPGSVEHCVESAYKCEVTLNMRVHFRKVVRARLPLRDVLQHLGTATQGAIDIGIFKFGADHASDGVSIFAVESRGPVLFKFNKRGLSLRLILRAVGGKCRQSKRQCNSKQCEDFHVQIVT